LREIGRICLQQIWHRFQERLGTNPKENFLCEKLLKVIGFVGGRTIQIRTGSTTRKWARNLRQNMARFSRLFWSVSCCNKVVQFKSYNSWWALFSRCCFVGGSYNNTNCWHDFLDRKLGQLWVSVSFLLLPCMTAVTFILREVDNKISLGGFPWLVAKILGVHMCFMTVVHCYFPLQYLLSNVCFCL
jgi:hypothetical protein